MKQIIRLLMLFILMVASTGAAMSQPDDYQWLVRYYDSIAISNANHLSSKYKDFRGTNIRRFNSKEDIKRYADEILPYIMNVVQDEHALEELQVVKKLYQRREYGDEECFAYMNSLDVLYGLIHEVDEDEVDNNDNNQTTGPSLQDMTFRGDEYENSEFEKRISSIEKEIQALKGKRYSSDNNSPASDNIILLWVVAGVACLLSIIALVNSFKKEKHHHSTNEGDNTENYNWIKCQVDSLNTVCNKSFSNAEKRLKSLEEVLGNLQKQIQQQSIPQQPQAPVAPVQSMPNILYVEPDSQKEDILFKQTTTLSDRHLYEIHLDSPDATQGEVLIRRGLSAEFAKKYIDGRNDYLKQCDIGNTSGTATRIEMKKPGRVVKEQGEWKVIIKPIVDLL